LDQQHIFTNKSHKIKLLWSSQLVMVSVFSGIGFFYSIKL